jgi:DNA-binding IclR family transcriptional regulator
MVKQKLEAESARTVGRVLKLLELVAAERRPIRLVDISTALDMPASSAHVLAKQLVNYNYIQFDDDRRYGKSTGLVALASKVMSGTRFVTIARSYIEALSQETGESIYLGMRSNEGIIYVDAIEGTSGLVSRSTLGSLRSAHASSAGRIFLAFAVPDADLPEFLGKEPLKAYTPRTPVDLDEIRGLLEKIRVDGYSVNDQALTDKVCGVSAPIFDSSSRLTGTITLSAPDTRFEQKKDKLIASVVACARNISMASG